MAAGGAGGGGEAVAAAGGGEPDMSTDLARAACGFLPELLRRVVVGFCGVL